MVLAKMGYITVYPKTRYTYRYIDIYILCVYIYTHYIYTVIYWLVVWNIFYFSIQLGISSSQLTFIFFRGVETTNQYIYIYCIIYIYIYIYVLLSNSESLAFRHGWIFAESWSSWLSPGCWGSCGLSDGSPKIIVSLSPRVSTIYMNMCIYKYINKYKYKYI